MIIDIAVTQEFIDHRTEKSKLYNKRGRGERDFLMDLDCEILEWYMINVTEEWMEDPDDWMVDAIVPDPDGYKRIDVKFISKWYNISCTKMHNIIQQRRVIDSYLFMEWVERPDRPLAVGDNVAVNPIGYIGYEDLLDGIKVSRGKWGGFYADPRKMVQSFDYDVSEL